MVRVSILARAEARASPKQNSRVVQLEKVSILARAEARASPMCGRLKVALKRFQSSPEPKPERHDFNSDHHFSLLCFNPRPSRSPSVTVCPFFGSKICIVSILARAEARASRGIETDIIGFWHVSILARAEARASRLACKHLRQQQFYPVFREPNKIW